MKDAGCWRTRFGVESGHDDVLDFISKGITTEKVRKAITAAHEVGLRPKAFFMVGHMPDTRERILATIEFAKGKGGRGWHRGRRRILGDRPLRCGVWTELLEAQTLQR